MHSLGQRAAGRFRERARAVSVSCLVLPLALNGCLRDRSGGSESEGTPAGSAHTTSLGSPPRTLPSVFGSAPAASGSVGDGAVGEDVLGDAGNWSKCSTHFARRSEPRLDVMRLGLMCGPSNGMKKLLDLEHNERGPRGEHNVAAKAGECFRLFVVAEQDLAELTVAVVDARARSIARATTDQSWLVLDRAAPFCMSEASELRVLVSGKRAGSAASADSGPSGIQYALELWHLRR